MNIIAWIEKIFLAVTGAVLVAVVFYQVVLRYVFNQANSWSEELARYLFIYDALIASALAIQKNTHLQVDMFINMLKPRPRCIANIISTLVGMVFLVFLFSYGITLCKTATNISPGVHLPMSWFYACIPIGCILMMLASILVIMENIDKYIKLGKEGGQTV